MSLTLRALKRGALTFGGGRTPCRRSSDTTSCAILRSVMAATGGGHAFREGEALRSVSVVCRARARHHGLDESARRRAGHRASPRPADRDRLPAACVRALRARFPPGLGA